MGHNAKKAIEEKYQVKVKRLQQKFKTEERRNNRDRYQTKWREKLPGLKIYQELDGIIETPIPGEDEPMQIGDFNLKREEVSLLKYPPKTTMEKHFKLKPFINDAQQMGCKLRWEARRRMEFREEQDHLPEEDIRRYEDLEEDERDDLLIEEGRQFQIYNREDGVIDLSKARVTDSKLNSHVTLPTLKSVEEEALINIRLGSFKRVATNYFEDSTDNGRQAPNLPYEVTKGFKSISTRIKGGEMVMLKTDKSDMLCPVSPEAFTLMGQEHTSKDREISRGEAYKIHEHQDCHTSQLLKCVQIFLLV